MDNVSRSSSYTSHTSMSYAKQRRSVSLLNLDSSRKSTNESLFDVLMSDPKKRNFILKMLSQENDNIKRYKNKLEKEELAKHRQIKKTQRLLHCESPTALQRRRALTKADVDSDSSSSISSTATKVTNELTIPFENLLEGVIVFVDIRSEGKDRSAGAKAIMQAMGATVLSNLTKNATHVLFKDGSFNTYQRAKLMKVHLVSVLWLEAIRKSKVRVPEKHFPALGTESYDANITQICQEYEEAVREEYNRSQAIPSLKHRRRTALPSDLRSQTAFFDLNNVSSIREDRSNRLSEKLVPSSQAWEAESIISHTSSRFGYKEQQKDDRLLDSPELTSDDSDCGIVNGESMSQERNMLYNLDLTIDNLNLNKANPTNSEQTSNCLSNLRSTRVSVDTESIYSHRSATLLSRTLERHSILGNTRSVNNTKRNSEETSTPKNRRTTLGVISQPSNEENLVFDEQLADTSDMEITLTNSARKRIRENSNREIKKKRKTLQSGLNSKENEIEGNKNESINLLRASTSKVNNTSRNKSKGSVSNSNANEMEGNENESFVVNESTNSLRTSNNNVNNISINKSSKNVDNSNVKEIERNKNEESAVVNESCNLLRAITSDADNTSTTPKKNLESSKVVDTSSSSRTKSISFKNDSVSSNIIDTSSERTRRITRSLRASLEPSCEEMPSLRISMSSNEKNSRTSDIPSLRLSANCNENYLGSGNLTKSKEVPVENPSVLNREPEQVQPDANKNNYDDASQPSQVRQKIFRKLFNLNDPIIDEIEIENKEVPKTSQIPKKITNLPALPLVHLQPLVFTQTVLDVIKKKNSAIKSKIPKKQISKKTKPSSESKVPKTCKTNTDKVNKKRSKTMNEEVTLKKAVRKSQRLELRMQNDSSEDEIPIIPQLSRRSTLEFMEVNTPMRTQKFFSQSNKKVISSIVCTRMHKPEVHTFIQIVKKLKGFTIEDEVSTKTSHLVVGDCKRTINLLRAITRGCWIVSKEWLFRSLEAGKWLKEEDYELTSFSPAVQECRKQRQAFNSLFAMDVFINCGPIYVSRNSVPRYSDLEELILSCKGTLADNARNASVVVGIWVRYEEVKCVSELWVLDCITFNKQKSFKHYLLQR